ncbi:MAG: hypothetical protein FD123_675 [Bacteroidetes bacterium]|nr:MAG: hypothetical protein FD123_675 [Bacteroidota bacterium]
MAFFKDLGRGFSSHIDAIGFIFKHGLWVYFIYPMLIAVGLYLLGFASMFAIKEWLTDLVIEKTGLGEDNMLTEWAGGWIKGLIYGLVSIVMGLLSYFLFNSISKYLLLIILSPVLAFLSERVEEIRSGNKFPFVFSHFVKDVLRGILITFRNMLVETLIILACFFIAWIPVIGWFTALFLYFVSSYYLGFSMMDYSCERRRLSIRQGVKLIRKHKGIAIGNGIIFSLLLMVPYVGISIGPILSVVAATLATLEILDRQQQAGMPPQNNPGPPPINP